MDTAFSTFPCPTLCPILHDTGFCDIKANTFYLRLRLALSSWIATKQENRKLVHEIDPLSLWKLLREWWLNLETPTTNIRSPRFILPPFTVEVSKHSEVCLLPRKSFFEGMKWRLRGRKSDKNGRTDKSRRRRFHIQIFLVALSKLKQLL